MIIATIPSLQLRALQKAIPKEVRTDSKRYVIEVASCPEYDMGSSEACWIACRCAFPHIDDSFEDTFMLTLTVIGAHRFGDITGCKHSEFVQDYESDGPGVPVPPGTFFIVDPLDRHWLAPMRHINEPPPPWIGLQWLVPRKQTKRQVQKIVSFYEGAWSSTMGRYKKWKPT